MKTRRMGSPGWSLVLVGLPMLIGVTAALLLLVLQSIRSFLHN